MAGKRKATQCSVPDCNNGGYITRGLCKMHYARMRRRGTVGEAAKQHSVTNAGKICTVPDCDRPVKSKEMCAKHYKRDYKHGDVTRGRQSRTFEKSFDLHVDRSGECWEWAGGKYLNGYAQITSGRQQMLAHRWSYEHHRGPIPDGMVIDHLCRNRGCVNPSHMEIVTNEENLRRGAGYAIRNGMRTTCIHGHKYTPENTYRSPGRGEIRCRECARIRDRQKASTPRKAA